MDVWLLQPNNKTNRLLNLRAGPFYKKARRIRRAERLVNAWPPFSTKVVSSNLSGGFSDLTAKPSYRCGTVPDWSLRTSPVFPHFALRVRAISAPVRNQYSVVHASIAERAPHRQRFSVVILPARLRCGALQHDTNTVKICRISAYRRSLGRRAQVRLCSTTEKRLPSPAHSHASPSAAGTPLPPQSPATARSPPRERIRPTRLRRRFHRSSPHASPR